ncbi:MAG: hypothetical protein JWL61_4066, partial [Gemmatimonadetes bacterium]|nr:hypothetical protein [Gemmatimonadota bacterium]
MSSLELDAPDDPAVEPSGQLSPSRRRFLLQSAAIAAAACLPRAMWGADVGQANTSAPSREGG